MIREMTNVRSFCDKKIQHCEIANAVDQVEEEKPENDDFILIGLL